MGNHKNRFTWLNQQNFFFLSKSRYENTYMAIDQNKINSILATIVQISSNSVINTSNQPKQVTYSSILITWHIFPLSLIFPNWDRTLLCFHRPMHPTGTNLSVLFICYVCRSDALNFRRFIGQTFNASALFPVFRRLSRLRRLRRPLV